jgi:LmeA-like phospholipid-binding
VINSLAVSRTARRLMITVVVLAVLAIGADRLAVRGAQYAAARTLQASQGLAKRPVVNIRGFPFLTQLASGTASGLIPYAELSRDLRATIRYASGGTGAPGRVEAARTVTVSGRPVEVTVGAQAAVVNGVLHFVGLTVTDAGVPASVLADLRRVFGTRVPLSEVPFGLHIESVRALPSGVAITLTGENLTFKR